LGEQNHPLLDFGGTHTPNVSPFIFGYQWLLLSTLKELEGDFPMKKAAK
jgi:hypothetical protein